MPEILETIMLICFGVSWPISIYKNYKSRTAAGMSKFFIYLIIVGYIAGITAKIVTENYSYVLVAYIINLVMLLINLCIYYSLNIFVSITVLTSVIISLKSFFLVP